MKQTLVAVATTLALAVAGPVLAQSSGSSGMGSSGLSSGSSSMGASGGGQSSSRERVQQMQKQADADYKSAKAQCDTREGQQKTLCEKQAKADHAQAELEVEKAKASQQQMGAGKSTQ
jgi:preprotein translocase subunit SecG